MKCVQACHDKPQVLMLCRVYLTTPAQAFSQTQKHELFKLGRHVCEVVLPKLAVEAVSLDIWPDSMGWLLPGMFACKPLLDGLILQTGGLVGIT